MSRVLWAVPAALLLAAGSAHGQGSYVNFETVPTRPVGPGLPVRDGGARARHGPDQLFAPGQ